MRGRVTASNGVALRQCALAGMGIALIPHLYMADELRAGTLVRVLPEYEATVLEFETAAAWMIYPSRSYLPLKVRVFADFLKAKFKRGAPNELPRVTTGRGTRKRGR